jgi:hypothetical protein
MGKQRFFVLWKVLRGAVILAGVSLQILAIYLSQNYRSNLIPAPSFESGWIEPLATVVV